MPNSMKAIAMPQLVPPTEFKLDNPDNNARWASYLLRLAEKSGRVQQLQHDNGPSDIHVVGTNAGYLFRYQPTTGQLDFFVQYVVRTVTIAHRKIKVAMQKRLWIARRSLWYDYTLAREAFYAITLRMTGVVISDIQQTDLGRNYWIHRVNEIVTGKRPGFAYLWDRRTYVEHFIRVSPETYALLDAAWGVRNADQMSRLIISDRDLHLPA